MKYRPFPVGGTSTLSFTWIKPWFCIRNFALSVCSRETFLLQCPDARPHASYLCDDQYLVARIPACSIMATDHGRCELATVVALRASRPASQRNPRSIWATAVAPEVQLENADRLAIATARRSRVFRADHPVRTACPWRHAGKGDLDVCTHYARRHRRDLPLGSGIAFGAQRTTGDSGAPDFRAAPFLAHAGMRARHGRSAGVSGRPNGRMVRIVAPMRVTSISS
jgi:hypothetical protein